MQDQSTTYYIKESENIIAYLINEGIKISPRLSKSLEFISEKSYNNRIGYYQFKEGNRYIKFFVIPKIHEHLTDSEKEKAFVDYLREYYRLNRTYDDIKVKDIKGNIIDYSISGLDEMASFEIQDFVIEKYKWAFDILERFFRKHIKVRRQQEQYVSQTIRHPLNLIKNIRSVDKTKIHQVRYKEEMYSEIALIAEYAMANFRSVKVNAIHEEQASTLTKSANKFLGKIRKRYSSSANFTFKDRDIITQRVKKLFKKNRELREVYVALLVFLGMEHFHSDTSTSSKTNKLDNVVALFFRPEDLYEWIVYDRLMKEYPDADISKDNYKTGTEKSYKLMHNENATNRKSKPDIIMTNDDVVTIIDAKWKTIEKLTDIQFTDIAKLKRDYEIRKNDYDGSEIRCQLIYPDINFSFENNDKLSREFDGDFHFSLKEIIG